MAYGSYGVNNSSPPTATKPILPYGRDSGAKTAVTYRGRKRASRQQISADERSLDTRNVPQALIRAKKQYAGGRLTEAEVSYKQILGIQPREPEALHMMGLINHKLGNNARALRLIKKSLSIKSLVRKNECMLPVSA